MSVTQNWTDFHETKTTVCAVLRASSGTAGREWLGLVRGFVRTRSVAVLCLVYSSSESLSDGHITPAAYVILFADLAPIWAELFVEKSQGWSFQG